MPRLYHSPSSIVLGRRCERAWAYVYIANQRSPDVAWGPDIENAKWNPDKCAFVGAMGTVYTAQQRGASLGKVVHATFELYFDSTRGTPNWTSFPGRIAHSGVQFLPSPTDLERAIVEHPIGDTPIAQPPDARPDAPTRALRFEGILWAGFRDLLPAGRAALQRVGIDSPHGMAIIDYKTSSNIAEHALTPDELLADPQAALYTIDAANAYGHSEWPLRWLYLETKKIRKAEPRDALQTLSRAEDVLGPCATLAKRLDTYERVEDAPQNPLACGDYGPPGRINCPHHRKNGGTCDAKQSTGALVQALTIKRKIDMALSSSIKDKVAAIKASNPVPETASTDTDASTADDASTIPPPPAAPKTLGKKGPKAKGALAGSLSSMIAAANAELAEAEQALSAATEARDSALAKLREALA